MRHGLPFLVLLAVLALWGCFQKLEPIHTLSTEEGVAFEMPEIAAGLAQGHSYRLLDLAVFKRNCTQSCAMWFVVSGSSRGPVLDVARIVYGQRPPGTVTRNAAQELTVGTYSVSATIQQLDADGGLIRSISLDSEFSIRKEAAGISVLSRGG